jgi:hypothetical protein
MTTAIARPSNIDCPTGNFFAIGTPTLEFPYNGDENLQVLKQAFVSYSSNFPALGEAHPSKSAFKLFYKQPQESIAGGLTKCVCCYVYIKKQIENKFWQSVTFYGIRQRKVEFTEDYLEIKREQQTLNQVINGTLFITPYVTLTEVPKSRQLTARNLVAREPFTEDVICTRVVEFTTEITSIDLKKKLAVKDVSEEEWKRIIEATYEKNKHEKSTGFSMPAINSSFSAKIGTSYLSETSEPSSGSYTSKIGGGKYIVQPTSIEPYYGGTLHKAEYVYTEYK